MHRISTALIAATLVAGLTACGGGGGHAALPATGGAQTGNTTQQPASTQSAPGSFTVNIPPHASAAGFRNPKYISAGTQSMTISTQSGTTTTQIGEADLTPASANCTAVTGGGTQCNVAFVGTAGTATYVVSMYNQLGGKGSVLSTADIQATLTAGQNTNVPLSLDGVPNTVSVVLGVATLPVGTASSTGVFVQAEDASGNIIVGPGGFATPVGLSISNDTYGSLALSAASVTSPGQVVTLAYNGKTNVGATITPSISGATGTAATFAGSGALLTVIPTYNDITNNTYMYPEDIAANSAGNAAFVMDGWIGGCCSTYGYAIQTLTPAGATQQFIGDTSDPFNPPGVTPTVAGFTVVHGMSTSLSEDEFDSYDNIALNANGIVYYSAYYTTGSDTANCPGNTEESGTLGVLNPATGTTTEYRLKGYAGPIKIDSAGNVWFIESSGDCNGSYFIPGNGYAVGELPAGSGTVTETPFSTTGLNIVGYPADMSITPDGTKMFIADNSNNAIVEAALPGMTVTGNATLTNSTDPYAIATAPDGSTAWFSDNDPNDNYYYGYSAGSKALGGANLVEAPFPIFEFYASTMAYADGSFWIAGDTESTGIGRLSVPASGTPIAGYYQGPAFATCCTSANGQALTSIAAGGGYVFAADDDYGNVDILQYGAPSNGTITYSSRTIGHASSVKRQASVKHGHHVQNKARAGAR